MIGIQRSLDTICLQCNELTLTKQALDQETKYNQSPEALLGSPSYFFPKGNHFLTCNSMG